MDTDGFLEHSPSRGSLYYKGLPLQKIIPFYGGGYSLTHSTVENFKLYGILSERMYEASSFLQVGAPTNSLGQRSLKGPDLAACVPREGLPGHVGHGVGL